MTVVILEKKKKWWNISHRISERTFDLHVLLLVFISFHLTVWWSGINVPVKTKSKEHVQLRLLNTEKRQQCENFNGFVKQHSVIWHDSVKSHPDTHAYTHKNANLCISTKMRSHWTSFTWRLIIISSPVNLSSAQILLYLSHVANVQYFVKAVFDWNFQFPLMELRISEKKCVAKQWKI